MRRKRFELTIKERAKLERFCPAGVRGVRLVNRAKINIRRAKLCGIGDFTLRVV